MSKKAKQTEKDESNSSLNSNMDESFRSTDQNSGDNILKLSRLGDDVNMVIKLQNIIVAPTIEVIWMFCVLKSFAKGEIIKELTMIKNKQGQYFLNAIFVDISQIEIPQDLIKLIEKLKQQRMSVDLSDTFTTTNNTFSVIMEKQLNKYLIYSIQIVTINSQILSIQYYQQIKKTLRSYHYDMVVLCPDKVIIRSERKLKNKKRNMLKDKVNTNDQNNNKVIELKNICINQQNLQTLYKEKEQLIMRQLRLNQLNTKEYFKFFQEKDVVIVKTYKKIQFYNKNKAFFNFVENIRAHQYKYLFVINLQGVGYSETKDIPKNLIDKANDILQSSFFQFQELWIRNFADEVQIRLQFWSLYQHLEASLKKLSCLLQYKIQKFKIKDQLSIYQLAYPGIQSLLSHLEQFFKITFTKYDFRVNPCQNSQVSSTKFIPNQVDTLLQKVLNIYIEQRKDILKKGGAYKKQLVLDGGRKMFLQQFIAHKKQFFGQGLQDLLAKINMKYGLNYLQNIHDKYMFMKQIQKERLPQSKCLGCTQFFYKNINIYDTTIASLPLVVYKNVENMKPNQQEIKYYVCSMLNSGGGIILFGCQQKNMDVISKGDYITEKDKELYEQRLMSYIQVFQPKQKAKKSVTISFVPVYKNPYAFFKTTGEVTFSGEERLIKQKQSYRLREHIKGHFVMRVRVCPVDPSLLYYWNQNSNQRIEEIYKSYRCSQYINGKPCVIKMKNIARQIKKRVKQTYIRSQLSYKQRRLLASNMTNFNHECRNPDVGISGDSTITVKQQGSVEYEYASMIIGTQDVIKKTNSYLKTAGVGDFKIISVKPQNPIKSINNTAILYHKSRFQTLNSQVVKYSKKEFDQKFPKLINITNFIQLDTKKHRSIYDSVLSEEVFDKFAKWVHGKYSQQTISYYRFQNTEENTIQFFVQLQTNEATYYAFHVLKEFNFAVQFKNPLHLDKMNPEDKKQKFIKLLQSEGTKENYMHEEILDVKSIKTKSDSKNIQTF